MKKLTLTLAVLVLSGSAALARAPCENTLALLGSGISQHFWTDSSQTSYFLSQVTEEGRAYCNGLLTPHLVATGWGNFYVLGDPYSTTVYDSEGNPFEGFSATFECWVCVATEAPFSRAPVQISLEEATNAAIRLTGGEVVAVQAPLGEEGTSDKAYSYLVTILVDGSLTRVEVDGQTGQAFAAAPITDDEDDEDDTDRRIITDDEDDEDDTDRPNRRQ